MSPGVRLRQMTSHGSIRTGPEDAPASLHEPQVRQGAWTGRSARHQSDEDKAHPSISARVTVSPGFTMKASSFLPGYQRARGMRVCLVAAYRYDPSSRHERNEPSSSVLRRQANLGLELGWTFQ
jgi:hypothetical protein